MSPSALPSMQLVPIVFASATLVSTGFGGLAAVRFRDRLHLLLGFSSGAVLAVALEVLPAATSSIRSMM